MDSIISRGFSVLTTSQALLYTFLMGSVIFACRALPFLLFGKDGSDTRRPWILFVEQVAPPVAMTVLAVSSVASSFKTGGKEGLSALIAGLITVGFHLWKRNPLLSILGGTGSFMLLQRIFMQ